MKISIIIPVYNSYKSLPELYERLISTIKEISDSYEIIMVDDGSNDNSYEVMKELRMIDKNVKIIKLIKNYGQHNALICGFQYSSGEYIVTLDDDLQNPPEEIKNLFKNLSEKYDVVIGIPKKKEHNFFRNISSRLMNNLCNSILGYPKKIRQSSFRLFRKKVILNILDIKNNYPYLPAYIARVVSFDKITNVVTNHEKRKYGNSNYSLKSLIGLSFNLLFNYSSLPLKAISLIGVITSFSSMIYGLYLLIKKILIGEYFQQGWLSIIVLTSFLGGVTLLSLGIIGEYLKRVITEVSINKQYIIEEKFTD